MTPDYWYEIRCPNCRKLNLFVNGVVKIQTLCKRCFCKIVWPDPEALEIGLLKATAVYEFPEIVLFKSPQYSSAGMSGIT